MQEKLKSHIYLFMIFVYSSLIIFSYLSLPGKNIHGECWRSEGALQGDREPGEPHWGTGDHEQKNISVTEI